MSSFSWNSCRYKINMTGLKKIKSFLAYCICGDVMANKVNDWIKISLLELLIIKKK